jgi:hypothetical protein
MQSGNLNFLEPSGPLQACNETALPLLVLIYGGTHYNAKFFITACQNSDTVARVVNCIFPIVFIRVLQHVVRGKIHGKIIYIFVSIFIQPVIRMLNFNLAAWRLHFTEPALHEVE